MKGFFALELLDNRYPALHGLRVLSILSVVQLHVTWVFVGEQKGLPIDGDFSSLSLSVFFGMDLFFILSGFLIGSILLHAADVKGQESLKRFYLRRITRTFPSYYLVLTALALTTTLNAAQQKNLVYEYLYATNFLSVRRDDLVMPWGWSLALEEQFYLTVPLFFALLYRIKSDRARITLLASVWLLGLGVRLGIYLAHDGAWTQRELSRALYFRSHTRFDTLVCGILLAYVHRRYGAAITRWFEVPLHRALVSLLSLSCLWLLLRPHFFGVEAMPLVYVFAWGTVTSVMYFGWVLLLLHADGVIQRALSLPVFRRIATLGYGVYLVHIPLIDLVGVPVAVALKTHKLPMVVVWPVSLAGTMVASLAVAYVLHVLVEKPSLRFRDRVAA